MATCKTKPKRKKLLSPEELMALVRQSAKHVAELDRVLRHVFSPPPYAVRLD